MKKKNEKTIPFVPFKRPPEIEAIRAMVRGEDPDADPQEDKTGFNDDDASDEPEPYTEGAFISRPAGEWMEESALLHDARMLFDRFWYERELCILFADTNLGKSVLAVQLGDCITKGLPMGPFLMEAGPQRVAYVDLELTAKQFQSRYTSADLGNYPFSNFFRAVINPVDTRARKFATYTDYLLNGIENMLTVDKPGVLIIDNITCLHTSTFAVSTALSLMKNLQRIKNYHQIAILVLAHTPKRNPGRAITVNDLQGSKMLINFADSAFAMGQSRTDSTLRYLKQIKQRNTGLTYGETNICLCRIVKPANFVQFEFSGFDDEANHLQKLTGRYRRELEEKISQLETRGLSVRQIAAELNMPRATVHRMMKKAQRV